MTLEKEIRCEIEKIIQLYGRDNTNIIIFPFGEIGALAKRVLNEVYDIEPKFILDNNLCKYNDKIKPISILRDFDTTKDRLFLATTKLDVWCEIKKIALQYVKAEQIIELSSILRQKQVEIIKSQYRELAKKRLELENLKTSVGKYSYGPLCCNHKYIKTIGAFCSFALGTDVVSNHPMEYITTHPMIYAGYELSGMKFDYNESKRKPWYFEGVEPKPEITKPLNRRITIGNDVWLGRNVIITNSANIGNGVIAAAGAVITKDVPDYAVVAGVPARIIRYRYTPEQIEKLNKIAWWNWTDDEIRERYDDFYLDIESFLDKYYDKNM